MSVMTEVSDIEAVLEAAQGWEFADTDKIVLLGTSQGGITSAIVAARHANAVDGLILIYPAFLVSDAVHEKFDSLDEVPDVFPYEWITAGRPYVEDMWDYDVYEEIGNYQKKSCWCMVMQTVLYRFPIPTGQLWFTMMLIIM